MRAVVTAPVCPLTARPSPGAPLADEVLCGMAAEVLERPTPDYWKIRTHYRYEGFAPARCLCPGGAAAWEALPKKTILGKNAADVMACPSFQSRPLLTLPLGALVSPDGPGEAPWQRVLLPDGRRGYVRSSWLGPCCAAPAPLSEAALRQRLTDTALLFLHAPYRWGGKTPLGVDCSGLVSMCYLLSGIVICRDARMEPGFPIHPIDREAMGPGDLLYFKGHVAMYLGGGRYIHSTGAPGSDGVSVNSLDPAAPDYRRDLAEGILAIGSYFA